MAQAGGSAYRARAASRNKKKKSSTSSPGINKGTTYYNPDGSVARVDVRGTTVSGTRPTTFGIDKTTGNVVGPSNDNKRIPQAQGGGYEAVQADPTLQLPTGNVADLGGIPAPTTDVAGATSQLQTDNAGQSNFRSELDSVLNDLGIDRDNIGQAPEKTFADVYEQTLKDLGLPDIKDQFDAIQKEYADIQNELNDKIGYVNDNPWLTEGIRVRQVQKLQEKYKTKLEDATTRMSLFKDLYDEGQSNAKFLSQKMYDEQGKSGDFNEELLKKAIDIAERRATASSKGGYTSGALKYTDEMFAEDEAILQQSKGPDGYVDPTVFQNLYKEWVAQGGLTKDFLKYFDPNDYVNPKNTWLPKYLMPTGSRSLTTGGQKPGPVGKKKSVLEQIASGELKLYGN